MSKKYNAFISYKHSTLDSKVASDIQRNLEHFRVPSDIRKQSGMDKIARVFRDKEELPLTSDLTATIEDALNNSDHLIVICSKATKESIWVEREIEFFLKNHTHDKILTVITEGEPVDVVPEILQYKNVRFVDKDGNEVVTKTPTEFLACDYRGELKNARKNELPRLVAALLGCSYDDLIKRQKQYRRKRLITTLSIIGALLIILTGYFAWSTYRINKNYNQSLLNQSEYLAAESKKLYNDGDRLSAALLSLEALPTDGNNRPLSQNAIKALREAIYAYRAPGFSAPVVNASFNHKGDVDSFVLSDDGKYLAVKYDSSHLALWQVESGKQLLSTSFSGDISQMRFTQDKLLALCESLVCYDLETAQKVWTIENMAGLSFGVLKDKNLVVCNDGKGISFIDADTGKSIGGIAAKKSDESLIYFSNFEVSADNRYVVTTSTEKEIFIWDTENSTCVVAAIESEHISRLVFTDTNDLIVLSQPDLLSESHQSMLAGGEATIYMVDTTEIFCISPSGTIRWKIPLTFTQLKFSDSVRTHKLTDAKGNETSVVLVSQGNICLAIDSERGKVLHKIEMPHPIVDVIPSDKSVNLLLTSGQLAVYDFSDGSNKAMKYFISDIESGSIGNKLLITPKYSSSVYLYETGLYDTDWKPYEITTENLSFTNAYQAGNRVLFTDSTDEGILFYCFDIPKGDVIWSTTAEGYVSTSYIAPTVFPADDDTMLAVTSEGLLSINMATGELSSLLSEDFSQFHKDVYCHDGYAYFMHDTYHEDTQSFTNDLYRVNVSGGETELVKADIVDSYHNFKAFPDKSLYLFWGNDDDSFTLNIQSDDEHYTLEGITNPELTVITDDGDIILAADGELMICDEEFNKKASVPLEGRPVTSMYVHDKSLYVASISGELLRYSTKDYTRNAVAELDFYYSTGNVIWDTDDGQLLVFAHGNLNVYDIKDLSTIAVVSDSIAFDHNTHSAIVTAIDTKDKPIPVLGRFRILSVDELITKAQNMLLGKSLSADQKAQYGLSE